MTIAHTGTGTGTGVGRAVSGSPTELDLRRQLREAREEARALRSQAASLREDLEALAGHLLVSEHLQVETRVAYVELLARARAEVAEQQAGTPFRHGYLAGHLEEIGLEPPAGVSPDQMVAEGLAVAVRLGEGKTAPAPAPHSAEPHSAEAGQAGGGGANASERAPERAGAREGSEASAQPQPHTSTALKSASEGASGRAGIGAAS